MCRALLVVGATGLLGLCTHELRFEPVNLPAVSRDAMNQIERLVARYIFDSFFSLFPFHADKLRIYREISLRILISMAFQFWCKVFSLDCDQLISLLSYWCFQYNSDSIFRRI